MRAIWTIDDIQSEQAKSSTSWPPASQYIKNLSNQYQVNNILIGNITADGKNYKVNWFAWIDGTQNSWQDSNDSIQELAQSAIDSVMTLEANQYATTSDQAQSQEVTISLTGISELDDFAQALQKIRSIQIVNKISVLQNQASQVILSAQVVGGIAALRASMSKLHDFTIQNQPSDQSQPGATADYIPTLNIQWTKQQ